jgi:hypothetical protein
MERDLSQRFEGLIVAGDKANNRTGAYDGDGEPDNASEWPVAGSLSTSRSASKRCRLGPGIQSATGLKLLLSHGLALGYVSIYLLFDGFGDPSGWSFDWVLSGSWASGTCLSVTPGSCFMIVLPEGGSLFEITSFP